jgi:hypothetical protein
MRNIMGLFWEIGRCLRRCLLEIDGLGPLDMAVAHLENLLRVLFRRLL